MLVLFNSKVRIIEQTNISYSVLVLTCKSQIRDIDEWKEVIICSDQRFKVTDVKHPKGSRLSLIEIKWKP